MGSDLQLRILYVVPYVPDRVRTRPFHLIRSLAAEGHRVTLGTVWSDRGELAALSNVAASLESVLAERLSSARSLWNCIRTLPTSAPLQTSYSWCPALAQSLVREVARTHYDVVHVEHLRGIRYAQTLRAVNGGLGRKRPPIIYDSVDCIGTLFRHAAEQSASLRARAITRIELRRTERYEGRMSGAFDRVLVTSDHDRRDLMELAKRHGGQSEAGSETPLANRIVVLPNGVDLDYFTPSEKPRCPGTVVITGKMSYHANVTAVVRFAKNVMPRIWKELPGASLWVVGKDPPPEIMKLGVFWPPPHQEAPNGNGGGARIHITGTVTDIRPFLRRASIAVAPIAYGAGIQNKVLEALACGTPVIATPAATMALSARPGKDLVVAGNEDDLAEATITLLRNAAEQRRLSEAGRAFVVRCHNWRSILRSLIQVYRDAMVTH